MGKEEPVQEASLESPSKDFFQILLVDDEPSVRALLRTVLESDGYTQIIEADSGDSAISALSCEECHLIILDKNLPGIDGLEVLEDAKKLKPGVEVIMITGYGSLESVIRAMDLGAYSYITKPFPDIETILSRVEGALERVAVRYQMNIMLGRVYQVLERIERAEEEADTFELRLLVRDAAKAIRSLTESVRNSIRNN